LQTGGALSCIATSRIDAKKKNTAKQSVENNHQKKSTSTTEGRRLLARATPHFLSPASLSLQATTPITSAMNGALMMAYLKAGHGYGFMQPRD